MRRFLLFELILLFCCGLAFGQISPNNPPNPLPSNLYTTNPANSSSGGVANVGPVINVTNPAYSGCPAAPNADWATCFASVSTAANAAAYVTVGTPAIRAVTSSGATATRSSFTLSANITTGDTVLVVVMGVAPTHSASVTDGAGNAYAAVSANPINTASVQVFSTGPGAGKAYNGNITVTSTSGLDSIGGFAVVAFNVGSIGFKNIVANGSASTAPTISITTEDANNLTIAGISWFFSGASTIAAGTGTLQSSFAGTASTYGGAIVTNSAASILTALTMSGTLSQSSAWQIEALELRSVQTSIPSVVFPSGNYNYSSGLNFLFPTTLQGAAKSAPNLCYTGSAHAIDLGPTTLTGYSTVNGYQFDEYTVEGLRFLCGGQMTEGIYLNNYVLYVHIMRNTFMNFGNPAAAMIWSNGNQNDLFVQANYFWTDDNIARTYLSGTNASFTQTRFIGNDVNTVNGRFGFGGAGTKMPGVTVLGPGSQITDNNFNFLCPTIIIPSGTYGVRVQNNYIEPNTGNAGSCPGIQYFSNDGLHVVNNFFNGEGIQFFLQPGTGTETLTNALVAYNYITIYPVTTELISQNNVVGQTGNLSFGNMCAISAGAASAPCPKLHTLGGNINQWNNDYAGTCTMNGSTGCPAYSFLASYNAAPRCSASWTGTGTLTGLIKVATSTTALTITSTVAADTAVISWACAPEAQ